MTVKEKFIENGIEYIRCGDYYIPNIKLPKRKYVGKYGMLHKDYIMEYHKGFYNRLVIQDKLYDYLYEIDIRSKNMVEDMVTRAAKEQGITEDLKRQDQLKWVGMMNNIKAAVEEVVFSEVVYTIR